jgi:3-oxoacyl-[acyl-carrier protein] reductase
MTQNIPLRRFATLEDITNSARFLLSDEGGYITGETLVLDGGESLYKGMFASAPPTPKG